jgi:hypothetical protein
MSRRMIAALSAAGVALVAQQALGHHGWGGQIREPFELSGTLHKAVIISVAHSSFLLYVSVF